MVVAVVVLIATYSISRVKPALDLPQNWLIAACDVGQGDSTFIRSGTNSAVLVDVGPSKMNTGGETTGNCASKLGIETIDELQISHYHDDHIGGLKAFLARFKVRKAVLNPVKQPESEWSNVVKLLEKYNVPIEYSTEGRTGEFGCESGSEALGPASDLVGSATGIGPATSAGKGVTSAYSGGASQYCAKYEVLSIWDNLSKAGELVDDGKATASKGTKTAAEDDRENNSSEVVEFVVNGVSYWTAGDLETNGGKGALKKMQAKGLGSVDVVKVNHHGSKTQDKQLEQLLSPKLALYMVGKNTYGHPNQQTVDDFEKLGATSLRTDLNGVCGVYLDDEGQLRSFSER
ncbi:hypothetical protein FACS1894125_7130 [Actinomycetota bacterium]|nr:hypothetical protein FACS1894125_7130 [Actinomycetota bacterium]